MKCLLLCTYKLCDGFLAAVNKAYKMFDDEEQLEYCMGVAEEAKELWTRSWRRRGNKPRRKGKLP